MITRPGFPQTTNPNHWVGRSGKASYYPSMRLFKLHGGQVPAGALPPGAVLTGGALTIKPVKPRLMMDPSDASTWQRTYSWPV